MKKALIYILFMVLYLTIVSATLIPIELEINVDFDGEKEFRIILPNGASRYFNWEDGTNGTTQHADTTYVQTIYHDLDEQEWCENNTGQISQYNSLTVGISDVLSACSDVVGNLQNGTGDKCVDYKGIYDSCLSEKSSCNNASEDLRNQYNVCNTALLNTKDTLNTFRTYKAQFDTCDVERKKCEDGGFGSFILGALAGGAGLYFWLKRNRTGVPSEHSDAGSMTEYTGGIESQDPSGMRLRDPPRQSPPDGPPGN